MSNFPPNTDNDINWSGIYDSSRSVHNLDWYKRPDTNTETTYKRIQSKISSIKHTPKEAAKTIKPSRPIGKLTTELKAMKEGLNDEILLGKINKVLDKYKLK